MKFTENHRKPNQFTEHQGKSEDQQGLTAHGTPPRQDVSKNCFYPQPKVTSTVVTIQRERLFDEEIRLKAFEISKIAFQQKRKKIRSSLSSIVNEDQLSKLNLDVNLRASDLSPEDFLLIAEESK